MVDLDFQPEWSEISAITQAINAVVTFTANHDFVVGQTVMFVVEQEFGMREINGEIAKILSTTDDTITVNIDTRSFNSFSLPASPSGVPQVLPVGSTNWGFTTQGTVPQGGIGPSGSFRQITEF